MDTSYSEAQIMFKNISIDEFYMTGLFTKWTIISKGLFL
jgi:hypothetical protein